MDNKIVAYSLLAFINNQGKQSSSFENIFIPLVKRTLSKMCAAGKHDGDDISIIKQRFEELYSLNMPVSVLKKLLVKIAKELNKEDKTVLTIYGDNSFVIGEFIFADYEEEIEKRNAQLDKLHSYYESFLQTENIDPKGRSVFSFVEKYKSSLGKYIGQSAQTDISDDTLEARFVNFIKPIEGAYDLLRSIYIGSIITTYLEYEPTNIKRDVELVLDTNFIISLLDLNTASSKDSCRRLLDISGKLGYRFSVLSITIQEIDQLLKTRVDNFDIAFLSRLIDPEDIYNACERRNLNKTDLDRIRRNVQTDIEAFGVIVVPHTEKYQNKAKNSSDYEKLKGVRNSPFAALHDATCIEYVKEKRGKPIYQFDKVNCWFLNNSSSRQSSFSQGIQPYSIKAEDLLNLLWLTSPMVKTEITTSELATIGLTRLVSTTLDNALPPAATIRELDANIHKYAKDNISDEDVVWVARGIAEKTLTNIDSLNELAENNSPEFVSSLQGIANEQKQKGQELQNLLNDLVNDVTTVRNQLKEDVQKIQSERLQFASDIEAQKGKYSEAVEANSIVVERNKKLAKENLKLKNNAIAEERRKFIYKQILYWRLRVFLWMLIGPAILIGIILYINHQNAGNWELSRNFFTDLESVK
ncbi:PIN domain-containing protein [Sediminibacterium soli]|uniref:hypothetical protein n=1 Tax=Sediminibacterium soli TaxID=2698829 RepID=UPI00137989F7|nr:hypothetical protein [Sediminibacterium soli]NCI48225.1 hypothetical protein [Sediminibacterium soli]